MRLITLQQIYDKKLSFKTVIMSRTGGKNELVRQLELSKDSGLPTYLLEDGSSIEPSDYKNWGVNFKMFDGFNRFYDEAYYVSKDNSTTYRIIPVTLTGCIRIEYHNTTLPGVFYYTVSKRDTSDGGVYADEKKLFHSYLEAVEYINSLQSNHPLNEDDYQKELK